MLVRVRRKADRVAKLSAQGSADPPVTVADRPPARRRHYSKSGNGFAASQGTFGMPLALLRRPLHRDRHVTGPWCRRSRRRGEERLSQRLAGGGRDFSWFD